ncbi:MAG: glycosyltransferase family 4 protein [Proteobacteria bacterium]|nr:glycosyltransferase family 4 protein [Pseudomonadota bacterium]
MTRRIAYIYHSFYPYTRDGGPNVSCRLIVEALAERGLRIRIVTSHGEPTYALTDCQVARGREYFARRGIEIDYVGTSNRMDPRLPIATWRRSHGYVLHLNEVWSLTLLVGATRLLRGGAGRVVISPRGMLQDGSLRSRRARAKQLSLRLTWPMLTRAYWHVTSLEERAALESRGVGPERIFTIPHPVPMGPDPPHGTSRSGFLYLGRIAKVKGLDLLLEGYERALAHDPGLDDLTLAGAEENSSFSELAAGCSPQALGKIHYLGEVLGERKATLLSTSRALVNTSYSENFGMSIAEALERGTPAIACEGSPWQVLNSLACGSYGERSAERIASTLLDFQQRCSTELTEMGHRGRAWIGQHLAPRVVADQYARMYAIVGNDHLSEPARSSVSERGS